MIRQNTHRYELKFLIDWKTYILLRNQIQPFVHLDNYCASRGKYRILSLYYDTPGFDCYFDKIDGNSQRHKFRIRWYLDEENRNEYAFLELKKKNNGVIHKKRLKINNARLVDFFKGDTECLKDICTNQNEADIAREMLFYYALQRLQPVVYTHYLREAYIGRCEHRLRITFDMKISCKQAFGHEFDPSCTRYALNPYYMVFEIKGFHSIPEWLINIANNHNLQQLRLSKYCMAVDVCGLLALSTKEVVQ